MLRKIQLLGALSCLALVGGAAIVGCGDDSSPTDAGLTDANMVDANTPDFGVGEACATAGETRPCGTDVGACVAGTQTCGSDRTFGECVGAVSPRAEICNAIDDDCDGTADNNVPGAGAACGTDQGECSMGTAQCVGTDLVCVGGTTAVTETCNGLDDDCDGDVDDGVLTNYWIDLDNDTYGDSATMMSACSMPVGYVTNDTDCDDACTSCFPGGTEVCDGKNNDCDAGTDEGVSTTYYQDLDSDARGNPAVTIQGCSQPVGYVTNADDCDDTCNVCWAGRSEVCDGFDNDCVGGVDNGVLTTYYQDLDADTRGNPAMSMMACSAPLGYVTNSNDCNDSCNVCWTGRSEVCDGLDNDCVGGVDNGVLITYYRDMDADTRGNPAMSMMACSAPSGYVTNANDCNDSCNVCWTGHPEVCDGFDNNCMGAVDEGVRTTYYRDADMDSRGNPAISMMACAAPSGYVANSDDCNDACNTCWTGNAESCDALDNNCSGASDEGFACVQGSAQPCTTTCGTTGTGVCAVNCLLPGAAMCTPPAEVCNSIDEDCDMIVDEGLIVRTGGPGSALGADGKLANIMAGYVAVQRRGAVAYAYRVDTAGAIRGNTFVSMEPASVVSVDIDRLSDTQWSMASTIDGTGVQVRLLGLDGGGNPTATHSRLVADANADGVARVAINSTLFSKVIYQAGSSVRIASVVSSGNAVPTSGTTLPGTQHRAELGMDVVGLGSVDNFVITWVQGASAQVHVALLSGTTVTSDTVLGAGSNPSIARDAGGNLGVVYVGGDNLLRFHHLTPTLTCLVGGAASTCARTLGTLTVNAPGGGFVSQRTLDIAADGSTFWISARVSDGEQVYHVSRSATHDGIHRTVSAATTVWMSLGAQGGLPLVMRGNSTAYTHDTFGCP